MKMVYNIADQPKFSQMVVFAFQQLLAILAATIAVPMIIGNGMSMASALFGAGIGSLIYVLFTKARSPVFLGSSFAFINSMFAAFGGAVSAQAGFAGLIIGAVFAGLIYVIIAMLVKLAGVNWLDRLMPPVVVGPTVAIIGLSLAGNAVGDLQTADVNGGSVYVAIICGLVTLIVITVCSTYGKKMAKLIPFIIGIIAGYAVAAMFTVIGNATGTNAFKIIDFTPITVLWADGVSMSTFISAPDFTFIEAIKGVKQVDGTYIGTIAVAYIPVSLVVFAEHVADHKHISSIIKCDLLKKPGLHRTLLGDGIGSMVGAFFGGCPNTTYGESIACVAITGNASVVTIICTAIMAIVVSFVSPIIAFMSSIPTCVMGGVCMSLYGFIAVSGLKILQSVDLNKNRNLFVASVILISGIGKLSLTFGRVTITSVATSLILGIMINLILSDKKVNSEEECI